MEAVAVAPGQRQRELADVFIEQQERLVLLAAMLVGDVETARDVVQDAFLGVQRNAGTFRGDAKLETYLHRAVINNARNALRKRYRARKLMHFLRPDDAPAADADLLASDRSQAIVRAVDRLPPRQREVIILRYWSEYSIDQIANELSISNGTVKSQLSRAIEKLRRSASLREDCNNE